ASPLRLLCAGGGAAWRGYRPAMPDVPASRFAAPAHAGATVEGVRLTRSRRARQRRWRSAMTVAAARANAREDSIRAVLMTGAFLRLWVVQALTQIAQNMINFALLLRVREA